MSPLKYRKAANIGTFTALPTDQFPFNKIHCPCTAGYPIHALCFGVHSRM